MHIIVTDSAKRDFTRISRDVAKRIERKLAFFASAPHPLEFAETLVNLPPATHRFRIGDWRVKFYVGGNMVFITGIDHRSRAYRR